MASYPQKPTDQEQSGRKMGQLMIYAMWIIVLLGLTYFFSSWLDHQRNPNQTVAGSVDAAGNAEVVLERNRYGHYVATGKINGNEVVFLLDTVATDVSIPAGLARQLGLRKGAAHNAITANGIIEVYATSLASVELGVIRLENVRASINPGMDGQDILLGMSFLRQLDFSQSGDRLTLKPQR